ncbi:hypothetical protein METBIDRAFT_38216 [Metschnikowia bicuspidata var. bicuspidata NRRL YB-4993]|uniref:Phosphatidylglycerol/phosphatidylinositol transfer protein n=1 Tax=Metschnikowia bicuspidata var. bicuspidata NRRL YB-4993 TaxID=869754 RepID=A0A1A0HK40_9ASCO|nr:hypothetical protein METBIDRAFT_38216 [Metschnikowia bicuspidata var. bicuspidata NRRL YB-4993]OBA24390.1 hypothetical protein METBIDRAFT_38216 [Metschnikowia bicuspidata var. bicuspidata NRRL YB-4993]
MVAIHRFAIAGLVASSSAFVIPSLDSFLDSVGNAVFSEKKNPDSPKIINTFPTPDDRPVPGNAPIINCESSSPQILDLQNVVIDPNPPIKGENLTFSAVGFLTEDIEEGAYVDVDVRYGFIKLIHQTFDLCEEVKNVDLECPIKKGENIISKLVEIPAEVPPGKYVVNARAYSKDDKLITCLTATVEFPATK